VSFYKVVITEQAGTLQYGVPDIQKMTLPRYRWPTRECAFFYPDPVSSLTEITEQEWSVFDEVQMSSDKLQIQPDGADTATITVRYPVTGGQAVLAVNEEQVDVQTVAADGRVVFQVSADLSLVGVLLELEARHPEWRSQRLFLRVAG